MGSDAGGQYFSERPAVRSRQSQVVLDTRFGSASLTTDRGVFSPGRVDLGTRVLLAAVPNPPASGTLLDLGCGYGPIAVALAMASPRASIVAVDVNERALERCRQNVQALGLDNVSVAHPDEVDPDERYHAIWSNPPIHVGKDALHNLLVTWLDRLTNDGVAHLVVQKHLGSDSLQRWLQGRGNRVERLASKKGYRVLEVLRSGEDPPRSGVSR